MHAPVAGRGAAGALQDVVTEDDVACARDGVAGGLLIEDLDAAVRQIVL